MMIKLLLAASLALAATVAHPSPIPEQLSPAAEDVVARYEACLFAVVRFVDDGASSVSEVTERLQNRGGCEMEQDIAASRIVEMLPKEERSMQALEIYSALKEQASARVVRLYRANPNDETVRAQQAVIEKNAKRDAEWAIAKAESKAQIEETERRAKAAAEAYLGCAREQAFALDDGRSSAEAVAHAISGRCGGAIAKQGVTKGLQHTLQRQLHPALIAEVLTQRREATQR